MKHALVMAALLGSLAANAHQGHLTDRAWHACEGVALGAACAFEDSARGLHRGSCRSMSESLICVRNQPVVPVRTYGWLLPAGLGVALCVWALRRRTAPSATPHTA